MSTNNSPEWVSLQAIPCSEPDGNELIGAWTAHTVMLEETGQCPWCGEER